MKTSFWAPYISDHTIHAICWTLIHSLWIGLAIALLAGLVITITRKSSAALRYNLLCGILVLFSVSVYVTFWLEMRAPTVAHEAFRVGQVVYAPDNHVIVIPTTTTPHLSFISRFVILLNEYSNMIFLAWLLFFLLKTLKMAGGLLYIQRIRSYKIHEVSEEFKHKIDLFARQIGISQTVRLVQSELVKVPVAVGWLKPMILLPMGVILQLPAEQIESILWHELAHIRRRDYLVNILQGLVETTFFFNPGLLWLSSLIRAEREACCDDIVLSRMNRKANYLEALLAIADENNRYMSLAMGIGSGRQLRDRMKRMVSQENKRLSLAEKVVLIIGLVALSAFTTLPKTTQAAVQHLFDVAIRKPRHADTVKSKIVSSDAATEQTRMLRQTEVMSSDTVHRKANILGHFRAVLFKNSDADLANNDISAEDTTGKKYHFIVADNKLVAMEINGEKVQESDLPKYQYLITEIDVAVQEKRHVRAADLARFKANSPAAKFKTDRGFNKMRYSDSMQFKPDAKFSTEQFKMRYSDSMRFKANAKFNIRQYKTRYADSLRFKPGAKFKIDRGFDKMHSNDSVYFKSPTGYLDSKEERSRNSKLENLRRRLHDDSIDYSGQKNRALSVIADLVHDKAVHDPASVKWFGLSNTEFIVNGQKQSGDMQQRYKTKYGIHENYGLYYGPVQMYGTGVFIDADPSRPPLPPGSPRPPKTQHEPRSGYMQPKYVDTNAWKMRQLIKQQQMFVTDQAKNRMRLMNEQHVFSADQAKQRDQLLAKQRFLLNDQQKELAGLKKKWVSTANINLEPVINNVIADLVNDHVINDKSDLVKFNLTNSALMVNGIRQPEEIHQKLKAKYLEQPNYQFGITSDPNFGLHFNAKNGNQGLGVTGGPDSP